MEKAPLTFLSTARRVFGTAGTNNVGAAPSGSVVMPVPPPEYSSHGYHDHYRAVIGTRTIAEAGYSAPKSDLYPCRGYARIPDRTVRLLPNLTRCPRPLAHLTSSDRRARRSRSYRLRRQAGRRPGRVIDAVRIQAAGRRHPDRIAAAQVEASLVERALDHAALQQADRQGRGHVGASIVDRYDALSRVGEEDIQVPDGHPAHRARRQLLGSQHRPERRIARPLRSQVRFEGKNSPSGHGPHRTASALRTRNGPDRRPGPSPREEG